MSGRTGRDDVRDSGRDSGRDGVRSRRAGRSLVALLLTAGGLALGVLLGPAPAFAADPVPAPAPYGGQLDAPDPGGSFDDEHMLEVAMLALGSLNGLAVAGVLIVGRFRGSSALDTRRALMSRTERGVPSGPRRPSRRLASSVMVPGHRR